MSAPVVDGSVAASVAAPVDAALLRAWPLPGTASHSDKELRGAVLVIGGSRELPGAILLAGTAALRAGAGKLMVATAASVSVALGVALPEARVAGLAESDEGGLLPAGASRVAEMARHVDAVLIGPGMLDDACTAAFLAALLPQLSCKPLVLDALAQDAVLHQGRFSQPVLLTPHAGEMAHLTGLTKEDVQANAQRLAFDYAQRWNSVLALKGAVTCIASAEGEQWRHEGHDPGLATSGSGDVLAGIAAGLAARGAPLPQAAVWAVALHARAGNRLGRRVGPLGYLAREVAAEIPASLWELDGSVTDAQQVPGRYVF